MSSTVGKTRISIVGYDFLGLTFNDICAGLNPVLDPDSLHAAELPRIVGDDDQSLAAGMAADLHVMRTARRSRSLQFGPDLAVMRRRFRVERQHVETSHEMLDGRQVIGAAS